jgi:hypothetical protein
MLTVLTVFSALVPCGIRLDDALDGGPAVCGVGASKRTCGPVHCFTGRGPESEVCHPRQPIEVNSDHLGGFLKQANSSPSGGGHV